MHSKRVIALGAAACAAALMLASCSGEAAGENDQAASGDSCGSLEDMTTISLAVNPGAQDLVVQTIKEQGLDTQYNLDIDVHNFQNPPASAQAVVQKATEVGFGGITTMAQARAQGQDVFMFGAIASPSNGVFTLPGSGIDDIGDLAGTDFGSFSANNSATFGILSAVASEKFGMGKLEDELGSLVTSPDAAVTGLLDSDEIDAGLLGSTASVVTELTGDYKKIGDLSAEYEEATGVVPVHVALTSTDSYAADHCSELVAFSKAIRDGVEYVQNNDDAWTSYAETLKLEDPDAPAALNEVLGKNFRTKWDQEQIDGLNDLLESLIPILGEESFIAEVPDGLFSLDYTGQD